MNEPEDKIDPNASTIPAPPPDDIGEINAEAWAKFCDLAGWDGFASEELDE